MALKVTINDQILLVPKGVTVLDAAKKHGIAIPTLCSHPMVEASGSCRICVVEIEGVQGTPTACTTPVAEGMKVRTDTPALRTLRKNILKLILSEHPYTCLVCAEKEDCSDLQATVRKAGVTTGCQTCPKNGFCELQTLSDDLGLESMDFPIAYRGFPVESADPLFDRDYNLCILCGRCVRMCEDVRRAGTLGFSFRGGRYRVGTAFGRSHLNAECRFCGACVDVCPTAALFDKRARWEGPSDSVVRSRCPLCAMGCPVLVHRKRGKVIRIQGVHSPGTVHQGQICAMGRYGLAAGLSDPRRLSKPLLKEDGQWKETDWQEAIAWSAERLGKCQGRLAVVISPQVSCEDFDVIEQFARAAGAKIFNTSILARPAVAEYLQRRSKSGKGSGSLSDFGKAQTLVVWGSDPSSSHPIAALDILKMKQKGTVVVVVDPRRTLLAERADLHVPIHPGQDINLVAELIRRIKPEKTRAESRNTEPKSRETGVDPGTVDRMAGILKHSSSTVFFLGSGAALQAESRILLEGIDNLASWLRNGRVVPVWGEINLPGTLIRTCRTRSGLTSDMADLLDAVASGRIKGLYAIGDLPRSPVWKTLDVLVAQSVWPAGWMEAAHALLPAAHILESGGSVRIPGSGRGMVHAAAAFPGESRPDRWIVSKIAGHMGLEGFSIRSSSPGGGSAAPVSTRAGKVCFQELGMSGNRGPMRTASGSLKKTAVKGRLGSTLLLLAGSFPNSYRGGLVSEWSAGMARICKDSGLEIHPGDARRLNVKDGDPVVIRFDSGDQSHRRALVTQHIPEGTVFMHLDAGLGETWMFTQSFPSPVKIRKGSL